VQQSGSHTSQSGCAISLSRRWLIEKKIAWLKPGGAATDEAAKTWHGHSW